MNVNAFLRVVPVLGCLAFLSACAHAGAGTEPDEEAAVAEGVRAGLRLFLPPNDLLTGPICLEVVAHSDFERGVAGALGTLGTIAIPMSDCSKLGADAGVWVKIQSYEWMDIVTHGTLDVRGTVETRPDERSNFRLSWWRATFHASLAFHAGQWLTLSADDLGRM